MSEFATVEIMCAAREARRRRQEELLARFPGTLVCFSLNIAGPVKRPRFSLAAMDAGEDALFSALDGASLLHWEEISGVAGHERFYCFQHGAAEVKRAACLVEDTHPLGRLFDLDVLDQTGQKLSREAFGMPPRKCLLCGEEASLCARSRRHSVEELRQRTAEMLSEYFCAKATAWLCEQADAALNFEVSVTPKPGLVDRSNNGSHKDMTYRHFELSTQALYPYWERFVRVGWEENEAEGMLEKLRPIGREAERAMLRATDGINTHKGAIFSLGILLAAAGHLMTQDRDFSEEELLAFAAKIAKPSLAELDRANGSLTHGEASYRSMGALGARGEAASGFPHAAKAKEALLRHEREGLDANDAGALALLALVGQMQDTNMIARVGEETALALQHRAKTLAALPPYEALAALVKLDEEFIQHNASPGGCADMLAAGRLLKSIFEE